MEPTKKTARLAGLLYLIVVVTGIVNLAYVPGMRINWKDAAETYANIQASEPLFRLGIVAGIIFYTAFLLLPFVLYKLLQHLDKTAATPMVVLAAARVPFLLYNLMLGCFGYLINFIGGFLFPGYKSLGIATFISLPASLGEIGSCLWLLIVGIKTPKTHAA
jgi:hypothetical protein